MKKLTLLIMAAFLMTAPSSCQKDDDDDNNVNIVGNDGIYNPEKKIYKYYYWDSYDEYQELKEIWNWNGNRLESIDHGYESYYSGWYVDWTETFSYEGDRLVRVDDFDNLEYTEFTYSDGHLKKVSCYYKYKLEAEYTFTYGSNNKISQVSYMGYDDGKSGSKRHISSLNLFLPKEISESLKESVQRGTYNKRGRNESITGSISFMWNGDNISNIHIESKYEGEENGNTYSEIETEEVALQYDSKFNPRKGFLNLNVMNGYYGYGIDFYSKNNVTQLTYSGREQEYENGVLEEDESWSGEYHYSYQYDEENYPIRLNRTRIYEDGTSYTSTYFYEYLNL